MVSGFFKSWAVATILLVLCYAASFLGPLSWFIPPMLLYGLSITLRSGAWLSSLILLVANPLSLYFTIGALDYAKGAPSLRYMGLPDIESYNVDPATRCFSRTGGCVVHEHEWVSQGSRNLAIHLLCLTFGPPARSYDGPYPGKEQALRLVSAAPVLGVEQFLIGNIPVGRENLEMNPEQIRTIAQDLRFFTLGFDDYPDPAEINVRAVLFEGRCLILRFVELDPDSAAVTGSADRDFIVLFDRKNMRPFAYYRIHGNSATRRPKIHYLPEHSR